MNILNTTKKIVEVASIISPDELAQGWSGGAMVLGYLDKSRAGAYCPCSRCGWGLFGHFISVYLFSFLSPSLWEAHH